MPVSEHGQLTTSEGIHIAYQWSYADAAARTGASGFVAADVGKMARQLDNNTLWMLTATTPTWVKTGGPDSAIDHGSISGLGDDDHTQYLLVDGSRAMTGSLNVGDFNITNVGDIALDSISEDGTGINVTLGSSPGNDFNVGGGKFVVEGDTGRIGIGQSAPESTMHINSANTVMGLIVDGHGDSGLSDNFFGASTIPVGVKCNSSDLGIMLEEYSGGEDWAIGVNATGDLIFSDSETSPKIIFQDGTYNVGIGTTTTLAQLHIESSATGAQPVLYLDQADVSEEIIEIASTEGTGNAVEAVGAKTLTTTHFIKITLNSVTRYIPCGTIV